MECKEEKLEKREEVTVQIGDLHIKVKEEDKRRKSRDEGREGGEEVKDSERDNFDLGHLSIRKGGWWEK